MDQKLKPLDEMWVIKIRGALFALGQATDTPLPEVDVQDLYISMIHTEIGEGPHTIELVQDALLGLANFWKWPSFPKPADILERIKLIRASIRWREHIATGAPALPEPATVTTADKEQVLAVIRQWKEDFPGCKAYAELTRRLEEARKGGE